MTSVLIVDDDDAFRSTLGRDLASKGFDVALASYVDEAIGQLTERPIDVLLTDLRMPGADGVDLLASIRSISPRTRAILMSGFATARDYQRAIECGAVRVLCKPFTSAELMQAIRQAVDCETGFRGSIHGLSLVDLLQMFHYARRSLAIVVDGWAPGHVFLEEGRIVHAVYRELIGEPALQAILAMPAGSLRTMVLPEAPPHSITREFSELLLDALRMLDESSAPADAELSDFDDILPEAAPRLSSSSSLAHLRKLDGCTAACVVDTESGVVLGSDGGTPDLDLHVAAAGYAEVFRRQRATIAAVAPDDQLCDVQITLSRHYHILHRIAARPTLCLYLILDRRAGNLGMVRFALAAAEAAFHA
ncbi:MAG: response regulator [Deltaproteobacteria bacterium]|nr:response regulator [Deltaproteobacteria bacterium]MCW5807313.1 response regulator [Deltaproteobacteria bacterium]